MPFVLPRALTETKAACLVLAFGKLSILEACSKLPGMIEKAESPCPRISVLSLSVPDTSLLPGLAGVHKWAPLVGVLNPGDPDPRTLVDAISSSFDRVRNLSISGYELNQEEHESLIRAVLDGLKESGFSKVRLLRPQGDELKADAVASREALDIVAFPYHGGIGVGLTGWVADAKQYKGRGLEKPAPHAEIAISPRLARLLVNLSGVGYGQTLLDPFCGSGTILAEGLLKGQRCIGFDIDPRTVKDAGRNLNWLLGGVRSARYEVKVGDARRLSMLLDRGKVDGVVTEPLLLPIIRARPRESTAEALVAEKEAVYADALASIAEVLAPGGRAVIVVPVIKTMEGTEVTITLEGRPLGLRHYQPGPVGFEYPVRPDFESTRWVGRAVYVFESPE